MEIILNVRRQISRSKKPYYQKFTIQVRPDMTIVDMLKMLNKRETLYDTYGNAAEKISFASECEEGVCGKCIISVNGETVKACEAVVEKLCSGDGDMLILEPVRGSKVIKDLVAIPKEDAKDHQTVKEVAAAVKRADEVERRRRRQNAKSAAEKKSAVNS